MKLIIQIPCHNEALTLPVTVGDLPRSISGIDEIERVVIDDGSTDGTGDVARSLGVEHVVRLPRNLGLARAFEIGLRVCLGRGADIVVNVDGDNQYNAKDIPALVQPILEGDADLVIGERPIREIAHFSFLKKILQRLGSWTVRFLSGTEVPDATSGFRALNREAAARLNVFSHYTYTLETIIQAGRSGIVVASVPVRVNDPLRESRLIRSVPDYLRKSISTILRIFILYQPLQFFLWVGAAVFGLGMLLGIRFLYFFWLDQGTGHIQSLILAAVLLLMGFQLGVLGLVADLVSFNRKILEDLQVQQRRSEYRSKRDRDESASDDV